MTPETKRKRVYPFVATICFALFTFIGLDQVLHKIQTPEEHQWIATSRHWWDRQVCTWLGACGIQHMYFRTKSRTSTAWTEPALFAERNSSSRWIEDGEEDPAMWAPDEKILREIPQYVLDHAPYVHLYSGEDFWPSDIADHLIHTTPFINYTEIDEQWRHQNLSNMHHLNRWGRSVYTQSDDNVEDRPDWLRSKYGVPTRPERRPEDLPDGEWFKGRMYPWQQNLEESLGKDKDEYLTRGIGDIKFRGGFRKNPVGTHPPGQYKVPFPELPPRPRNGYKSELKKRRNGKRELREQWKPSKKLGGKSDAPAVLITVDKGHGVVDAFWFFFYSYNLGNTVFNVRFGNHVGDWEHTMVRFYKGEPKVIFYSEHSGGESYAFDAVERFGKRPVAYSATGTHAMYATPGVHSYVLPFGLLHDITDRGPLWDPTLNLHAYTYDYRNDTLRTSTLTPKSPRSWFYFMGHWGDKYYPLSDPRQYRFAGQYHYVNGPLGPRFKNLGRRRPCQWNGECSIRGYIGEAGLVRKARPVGRGDGDFERDPEHNGDTEDPSDPPELSEPEIKRILAEDGLRLEDLRDVDPMWQPGVELGHLDAVDPGVG